MKEHHYNLRAVWTGNTGNGTSTVRGYSRAHTVSLDGKPELHLTTDNKAVGEPNKLNPEDLLVSAICSCHLMSYLYLCAVDGVVITEYVDNAKGTMVEFPEGGGHFTEVVLHPVFKVAKPAMKERAIELHHKAHEICYIANSVNFEVRCEPECLI